MSKKEIKELIKNILKENVLPYDPPSSEDWSILEEKFSCTFCEEFKTFIELMAYYSFPGEILNVSNGRTDGNDTISSTYDFEMNEGDWNPAMIPFYSIGNGDYFCLEKLTLPNSPVYYYYHDMCKFEMHNDSFSVWISELPAFLE